MLYAIGGLVLGEMTALFLTAEQGSFLLAAMLAVFSCAYFHGSMKGTAKDGQRLPLLFLNPFRKQRNRILWGTGLVFLGLAAGFYRMEAEEWKVRRQEEAVRYQEGKAVTMDGTISEIRDGTGSIRLLLVNCREISKHAESPERVYCNVPKGDGTLAYSIGMRLRIRGELSLPDPARNPGAFDYRLYCLSRGVTGLLSGEEIGIIQMPAFSFREMLRRIRDHLGRCLENSADPEDAGVLKAILLGEKADLEEEVYELYRKNGIAHILAISGLHVSMIGTALWKLCRRCGLGYGMSGGIAWGILISYGIMTGMGPSVTRAVCMSGISFLGSWAGRTYDLPSAVCVPAAGLLLWRPFLLTQASFQLSFLAVGAVFFPGALLVKRLNARGILKAALVSGSIQTVTAPVILFHSFELPLYGLLLNLIVVPTMACVVISGFLGMAAAVLTPAAAGTFLGGAHYLLGFYRRLGEIALQLPASRVIWGRPSWLQMAGFYTGLLAAVWLLAGCGSMGISSCAGDKPGHMQKRTVILSLVILTGSVLTLKPDPVHGLSVTFLDVGQGDCIVLQKERQCILVDCGSSRGKEPGKNVLLPYLKSRGITEISAAFVTHGDQDHVSGVRELMEMEEIRLGGLILSEAGREEETCMALKAQAEGIRIPVRFGKGGDSFSELLGSDVEIRCLFPVQGETAAVKNDQSLVLLIRYGRFRLLLTGDLEASGEELLIKTGKLEPVTVLKAGHHGANTSSSEGFLSELRPQIAVFSYGRKNRYGHPAEEVTERYKKMGTRIFGTGTSGAILLWTDGKQQKIQTWRGP